MRDADLFAPTHDERWRARPLGCIESEAKRSGVGGGALEAPLGGDRVASAAPPSPARRLVLLRHEADCSCDDCRAAVERAIVAANPALRVHPSALTLVTHDYDAPVAFSNGSQQTCRTCGLVRVQTAHMVEPYYVPLAGCVTRAEPLCGGGNG